jgi:hypothetical protein
MKATRAESTSSWNLLREILPDARKLVELLVVHPRNRIAPRGDGIAPRSVGADLEERFRL